MLKNINLYIILLLAIIFIGLILPATLPASHSYSEIWSFDMDEPHFMMPPLLELTGGSYPKFWTYGNFPAFITATIFSPFLLLYRSMNGHIDYFFLVAIYRYTQIIMALLSALFIYCISQFLKKRLFSVVSIFLLFTSSILYSWTIYIHPDIFQTATFIASTFFLILYTQKNKFRYILLSAVFSGFATSSKYWGVWIIPVIPIVVYLQTFKYSGSMRRSFIFSLLGITSFVIISFSIFLLLNLHFLTNPAVWTVFKSYNQNNPHFRLSLSLPLLKLKLSNITSPGFFGTSFIFLYLASLISDIVGLIKNKTVTFVYPIHLITIVFLTYYFLLFNDPVNLPSGERYLMPFIYLMIIPILSLFRKYFPHRVPIVRYSTYLLFILFLTSQILKIFAYPAKKINIGQSDLFLKKDEISLLKTLNIFYQKENYGSFKVRQWIKDNVKDSSTIYVEAYMNIGDKWKGVAPDTENDDLPKIKIIYDSGVKEEIIARYLPDFIFTKHHAWVPSILRNFTQYKLIEKVGNPPTNQVSILKKVRR